MAELEISPTKVGHVIIKAREYAAKVGAWDDSETSEQMPIRSSKTSPTTLPGPSSRASSAI